jgi:ABC-type antimicrobial peptide transport system permease subunit
MPLLAGRDFTVADARDRPSVVIVNESFVERFGLGRDAVGKRVGFGPEGALDVEIVGVVRDAKYSTVKGEIPAQLFGARRQARFQIRDMTYYVRAAQSPAQLLTAIPAVVAKLDPALPVSDLRTVDEQVRQNVGEDRLVTMLATALAVLATLLAALGLYGVLSYTVAQRTREIGLRIALGAPPARLRAMVLRHVAWMGTLGGVIGLACAALLGKAAAGMLFGLPPTDPPTLVGAVLLLGLVILGAGYLPARRASKIDPVVALRSE